MPFKILMPTLGWFSRRRSKPSNVSVARVVFVRILTVADLGVLSITAISPMERPLERVAIRTWSRSGLAARGFLDHVQFPLNHEINTVACSPSRKRISFASASMKLMCPTVTRSSSEVRLSKNGKLLRKSVTAFVILFSGKDLNFFMAQLPYSPPALTFAVLIATRGQASHECPFLGILHPEIFEWPAKFARSLEEMLSLLSKNKAGKTAGGSV